MKINPLFICLFFILCISSCSKDKGIAEIYYNNPPKDSINFAYRISTLYYFDEQQKETSFEFTLDTGLLYAWKSVLVNYEGSTSAKLYIPEYKNGFITAWVDFNTAKPIIEFEYVSSSSKFRNLISSIKYYGINNPFALIFNYDSLNLNKISRCSLDPETGVIGGVTEDAKFCSNFNIGSCSNSTSSVDYYYGNFTNSLYHCNELIPFLFILKNPNQNNLMDILTDLPLYFSKNYPEALVNPSSFSYDFGLNSEKEPSYFYYRNVPGNVVQGYNFSMR